MQHKYLSFKQRLRNTLISYGREDRGSVTIQIIFFSLLLLGTTAVVLDSGRVYDSHSQMQAYADQMALAAANELDGQDDAIQRATNAVYGFQGALPFLEKSGLSGEDFEVEHIAFYASMAASDKPQNDFTEAFPGSATVAVANGTNPTYSNDAVTDSNAAVYAVVKVRQASLSSAMFNMMQIVQSTNSENAPVPGGTRVNYANEGSTIEPGMEFSAVAAAAMERKTCADISTLVFCNPWENEAVNELEVDKDDTAYSVPGRSLMTFAPNFQGLALPEQPVENGQNHGSLYDYNVEHQLFRLTNPVADPDGICSVDFLLSLATEDASSESSADYIEARDRCLMARARSESVCWGPGDELAIAPADGDMVSRSINTAFDIWQEPFRSAITNNVAIPTSGTSVTRATFFEPDRLATTTYESADRFGTGGVGPQDGVADYGQGPGGTTTGDDFQYFFDTVPAPDYAMLLNVHANGAGYDVCHADTYAKYAVGSNGDECTVDFVGDYYDGDATRLSRIRSDLTRYWTRMYGLNPRTAAGRLPADVNTWYKLYQHERDQFSSVATNTANSRIVEYSGAGDTDPNGNPLDDNVAKYNLPDATTPYVKHGPDEFLHLSGVSALLSDNYERRRIRSAMVNCSATTTADDASANGDGSFNVRPEDIRVLDVYLPTPAGHFCGTDGELGCALEDSIETRMYVELIEDVTEEVFLNRFTVQLVR